MADGVLTVEELSATYGQIRALDGVSLHVNDGEVVAIVGANGAGKTTLMRTIAGLVPPAGGRVLFEGADITGLPAHRVVARGIGQIHEGRHVFSSLSVQENLEMGAYSRSGRTSRRELAADYDVVYGLFPRLAERREQLAGTLSGGEQQMLAIGRALMAKPRLLLLDEPSMGLAPLVIQTIFGVLRDLNARGLAMLLVEQNARAALSIARRAYVIATGRVTLSGSSAELADSPDVRRIYFGGAAKEVEMP
jgi:branched-chain amino acid transport system ATP-binding protein